MIDYAQDEFARHHFGWKAALYSGLCVGVLSLFLENGIPWNSFGAPLQVMGRPLFSGDLETSLLLNGLIQMVVALCYTFITAAIVYRMKTSHAIVTGGIIGLGLYGLNYLLFNFVLTNVPKGAESNVVIAHLAFCMIAAGTYKGFSIPKAQAEPQP